MTAPAGLGYVWIVVAGQYKPVGADGVNGGARMYQRGGDEYGCRLQIDNRQDSPMLGRNAGHASTLHIVANLSAVNVG